MRSPNAQGLAMLRLDYSGTGSSAGDFDEGTLDRWLDEALAALDRLTTGPVDRRRLVDGRLDRPAFGAGSGPAASPAFVGIAAAPDFTDWGFTADQRAASPPPARSMAPPVDHPRLPQSGTPLCLLEQADRASLARCG